MTKYNHILLIEDSDIDRYIAVHLLEKHFISKQITVVKSGQEALDWIRLAIYNNQPLPERILLDLRLPDMGGIELIEILEQYPPEILLLLNIVVVSSIIEKKEIDQIKNNKLVSLFIPKPLTFHSLNNI